MVEGALGRVEGEHRAHHHDHDQPVADEGQQLRPSSVEPEAGDEGQEEGATQQHRGATQDVDPRADLGADDVAPAPVEVVRGVDRMTDGELLVVAGDPERVPSGARERRAKHDGVAHQPGCQRRDEDQRAGDAPCPQRRAAPAAEDQPCDRGRDDQEQPVDPGERRKSREQARRCEPRSGPGCAHGARRRVEGHRTGHPKDREVLDGRVVDEQRPGEDRQDPAQHCDGATLPELPTNLVGERHQERAEQHHGNLARPPGGTEHGHEGRRDHRGERHPVPVAGGWQDRRVRQLAPEERLAEEAEMDRAYLAGIEAGLRNPVVGQFENR